MLLVGSGHAVADPAFAEEAGGATLGGRALPAWRPDWGSGQAAGGADALLGRQTLADLAANENGLKGRRLELELGYGKGACGGRFTATPGFRLALSDAGRELSLGWKLGLVRNGPGSFELGIEAARTEPANDRGAGAAPEHGVRLRLEARF